MTLLKSSVLIGATGLIFLSSCTDINTPTDNKSQRTGEGAAIGAVTGAALGTIIAGNNGNDKAKGAVTGAVVGGVVGGLIGNSLDKQAAELQTQISNDRIIIIREGDKLIVRMPDDILFDVDSTQVKKPLRADLRVLARSLNNYPDTTVVVTGHTDNTGSAEYNQNLSLRRAQAVTSILTNNGVNANRLRARGRGESDPIATNQTPEGRAQNRRVEIVIRQRG